MATYYNENDPFAAAWLRELIKAGLIADGDVDDRSIEDVRPGDLNGYKQCHFFAGIGGWSYALRLAGWPDDRPVWTGSCPCQPFSISGRRRGTEDARHLWPHFFRLIQECEPAIIFGEQVASRDGYQWWDIVSTDMETRGYAVGAANLCAAGVFLPHIRQRLYWVGISDSAGLERHPRDGDIKVQWAYKNGHITTAGYWRGEYAWIRCWDGRLRPVKSGISLLVDGFPARDNILRCLGNAIVPQVGATFIKAVMGGQMEKTYMQKWYEELKKDPERYRQFRERSRQAYEKIKADPERYKRLQQSKKAWATANKELLAARKRLKYQEDEAFREKARQYAREYKARKKGERNGQGADEVPAGITTDKP